MTRRPAIRTLLSSLALATALSLAGAGAALAEAPHHVMISDAACNQGTTDARLISGNGIVPMYMSRPPVGCMVMVGAFNP